MATTVNNVAIMDGQYGNIAFNEQSENAAAVILEMSIALAPDSMVWAKEMVYTVKVTNGDTVLPLTNLVLTDTLDPALVAFVPGSVTINGVPAPVGAVTYDATSGLLTVLVPDVVMETTTTITFRIAQK